MTDLTRDFNLSEFIADKDVSIIRTGRKAEVIIAYDEKQRPIRILGFSTDASKDDFQIYEEAFEYFRMLRGEVNKRKHDHAGPIPLLPLGYAEEEAPQGYLTTLFVVVVAIAVIMYLINRIN